MKKTQNTVEQLAPYFSIVGLSLLWEGAVRFFRFRLYSACPQSALIAAYDVRHLLLVHTGVTLGEALTGLLLSIVVAL